MAADAQRSRNDDNHYW